MISQTVDMATKAPEEVIKRSARERLLDAASVLFYAEGIQSVGIDRVIERAGVAKASLYSTFGSKEELVRAYLDRRHTQQLGWRRAAAASVTDPVEKILAVVGSQARDFTKPDFNGCAFSGAMAESPVGGRVYEATHSYREDIRTLFEDLARGAGAQDPVLLARQLQFVYEGASNAAKLDRDTDLIAVQERSAAQTLIAAALA